MHPHAIANPNESLLQGSQKAQGEKFNRVLKKVLNMHRDPQGAPLCQSEFGVAEEDITMYSFRKASHTKLNCGSTAGPTAAAVCLREGHSLGGTRNPYIAQEKASDEYCGRIVAGLPLDKPEFAASYPDFIPIPIEVEKDELLPVSSDLYKEKKKEVYAIVREVLDAIFTSEHMDANPTLHPFLRIGLASHLMHIEEINNYLPTDALLRQTPLYTNAKVEELKQWVRIAMPWEDHYIYFADSSGLPPHVTQLSKLQEILKRQDESDAKMEAHHNKTDAKIDALPGVLEELLDDRQMAGPVSVSQIKKLIDDSPRMKKMEAASKKMEAAVTNLATTVAQQSTLVARRAASDVDMDTGTIEGTGSAGSRYQLFQHEDGKSRRIPSGWKIPSLSVQHMYSYWHCGDESSKISPIKLFNKVDLAAIPKSGVKDWQNLKRLMRDVDAAAAAAGVPPKHRAMTQAEANACFLVGRSGIKASSATPSGRLRNVSELKWATAVKYQTKKN